MPSGGALTGRLLSSVRQHVVIFLATGAYTGYCPVASGTAGSLVGVAIYWALSGLSSLVYLALVAALVCLAIWLAGEAEAVFGQSDSGRIVCDEVVGFLVAMFGIPARLSPVAVGFVLFRLFDIVKLPPARQVERRLAGGYGVVMDDVVAGIYANIFLRLILSL